MSLIYVETPTSLRRAQDFRNAVADFERAAMEKSGWAQEFDVKHHHSPGQYAREIFLPAGTVITSKIHKVAHLVFITQGSGVYADERGEHPYEAPVMFVSEPGKRVVYAKTDTVWTTVHATAHQTLEDIEREVIAPDYEALEQHQQKRLA